MNLKEMILMGESDTLEFKKSTGEWKEITKTISAFANTKGGTIILRNMEELQGQNMKSYLIFLQEPQVEN